MSWYELYMCDELDQAVQILTSSLTSILDRLAPVRTVQSRTRYAPWLTKETKSVMRERDAAQVHAADTQHPDYWRMYRNLRNTVTGIMRKEKSSWEKQGLDYAENN